MPSRRDFNKSLLVGGATLLAPGGLLAGESSPIPEPQASQRPVPEYTLLIKGGTVVDPGQQMHDLLDVALKDGVVAKIAKDIPASSASKVVSATGKIVTPGFIDLHTHDYDGVGPCVNADRMCLSRGVTTVVDAGSAGYQWIDNYCEHIIASSKTRISPLVHIVPTGANFLSLKLSDPENLALLNPQLCAEAVQRNRPVTVGVKVQLGESIQGANDVECLKRAIEAGNISNCPVMAHIDGQHSPLSELLPLMRKGDVFTHPFNGNKNNMLDSDGKIRQEALEARKRGVLFDVAEGGGHLSFEVAEKCLKQNFLPDTLSTDLTVQHTDKVVFDLPTEVSKWLALGVDFDKAIAMVTVNSSKVFDYGAKIGTLAPGNEADVSIWYLDQGNFEFRDNAGVKRLGHQRLVSYGVVRHGTFSVNYVGMDFFS